MKFFRKWLKPDPKQQSAADESEQVPVSARARSEGEHRDDSSFSGSWAGQADSRIFDTGRLKIEKSKNKSFVSNKPPDLEGDSPCDAEENTGVDPYNTGRFYINKV